MNPSMSDRELAEAARLAADTALANKALLGTVAGSATAVYGGYTLNEWAMVIGALAALLGLAVQVVVQFHSWRLRVTKEQRDVEWHKARMASVAARRAARGSDSERGSLNDSSNLDVFDDSERGRL